MMRLSWRLLSPGVWFAPAFVLLLAPLVASAQAPGEKTTLVVSVYGGDLGATVRKIYVPFEKKYNVAIKWEPGVSGEALAKIIATRANPVFDIAFGDDLSFYAGSQQGVWAPLDDKIVTHYKELAAPAQAPKHDGAAIGVFYTGIFYFPKVFQQKGWPVPTKWSELLNPAFCNVLGFPHPNVITGLDALLMLAGGKVQNMDQGIDKLAAYGRKCIAELEPSPGALEQKIQMGDYSVGAYNTIRVIPLEQRGVPIAFVLPQDGSVLSSSNIAIVKGSHHIELAQRFVDWILTPDAQNKLMHGAFYTPTNTRVEVTSDMQKLGVQPWSRMEKLVQPPEAAILAHRRAWTEALDEKMSR
jgi:putative spermidine/putrescine transport system substrate-binding protein